MSGQRGAPGSPQEQLDADTRLEARLFWKGALSLALVIALAYARQRWWV